MSEQKHDCWTCKYRGRNPGTAHIKCTLLESSKFDPSHIGLLAAITGQTPRGIEVNPQGRAGGWATWPIDFDPVWIDRCDYYRKKEE